MNLRVFCYSAPTGLLGMKRAFFHRALPCVMLFRPYGAFGHEESLLPQGVALCYVIMPLRGGIKTANDNIHNSYIITDLLF
jgi:hypothetical protein